MSQGFHDLDQRALALEAFRRIIDGDKAPNVSDYGFDLSDARAIAQEAVAALSDSNLESQ